MLTLITGRAGTGKTAFVMSDIKRRMAAGESGLLLIVPEQYSHDAERQLCAVCGDRLSLYGETLSFTRLCGRVFPETGGAPPRMLDGGGQLLAMHRAFESVAHRLKVFGNSGIRTELLEKLLDTVKEFKTLRITADALESLAERLSPPLSDKLRDLSLIFLAYDSLLNTYGADREDRLTRLADKIFDSTVGDAGHVFFDGFNDFTEQELRIIGELLRKDAQITVCLTLDPGDDAEIFEIPRRTGDRLRRIAAGYGVEVSTLMSDAPYDRRAEELVYTEKNLFSSAPPEFPGKCSAVTVFSAQSIYAECEYAAAKVLEYIRGGYRWRDVGVMARDWNTYGRICENIFEKYGIPFFSSGKADVPDKPPAALIDAALEIAVYGFEYRSVFRYLKTGLPGVGADDCAELENYVLIWNIRGSVWAREWILPPSGYGGADGGQDALARLNNLRRKITEPLARLSDGIKGVSEVEEKLRALYQFLESIKLPERISEKVSALEKNLDFRLAEEYSQIWDIIVNAMEQMAEILSGLKLSAAEFRKLLTLTLSHYDVGVIPVSLDRTALGSMTMSRRRDLKCLILLGATDDNMPTLTSDNGILSDNERGEMAVISGVISAGPEERLYREMNMLYSAVTMPSRELIVSYPGGGGDRPSFIVKRLLSMFGISERTLREDEYMTAAVTPCFELAAFAETLDNSPMAAAAREYFSALHGDAAERLRQTDIIARTGRGKLSESAAEQLYGRQPELSASRVNKYYECPFAHFLQNGLKLHKRIPAGFDASQAGLLTHFVLERVSREIQSAAGFKEADEKLCAELTTRYINEYIHDVLFDFEGVNARFIYLFNRLADDVRRIVSDMLEELKHTDFMPLDFELDFKELAGGAGSERDGPRLRGVVDRVDGFRHNGRIYLRVIDYKTGKKSFSLSDALYGRDMQMLIYLFALQKFGRIRYHDDITPAGVLYIPARDMILKAPRNVTEDKLADMRANALRRDGLVLDDPLILDAMENGEDKKYLPVRTAPEGGYTGDSLVSAGQIAMLSKHVGAMLQRAGNEMLSGGIDCSPFYKSAGDNACLYCEFSAVCAFDETSGDRRRFVRRMSAEEVWEAIEARVRRDET